MKNRIIIFLLLSEIIIIADAVGRFIAKKYILTKIDIENHKNYLDKKDKVKEIIGVSNDY